MGEPEPPWKPELDAGGAGIDTYRALLLFYLERDGYAVPTMAETPAARAIVDEGRAQWEGPLRIVPAKERGDD